MTYGIDPEDLDRIYRASMTRRAIAGRFVMVVLLLVLFTGIVVTMAH